MKSTWHVLASFIKQTLAGVVVFVLVAGVALLLDYVMTRMSDYQPTFLIIASRWTQYALLTADVAFLVVMQVRAVIRVWKALASDAAVADTKHD